MRLRALSVAIAVTTGAAACGESPPPITACGELEAATWPPHAQCGSTLDFTPINSYRGDLTGVQDEEDAVVLIDGSCTGTLIAAGAGPVVLTAGHCVGLGNQALVAFNVEASPDGDALVTNGTVIERATDPDYALIRLDALPAIAPTELTRQSSDRLAIIQHPRGGPKVVAEGDFLGECDGQIVYTDLDTLVGSSGAGVLTRDGQLLGVHTDGDCDERGGGSNRGWSAERIVEASSYLVDADLGAR